MTPAPRKGVHLRVLIERTRTSQSFSANDEVIGLGERAVGARQRHAKLVVTVLDDTLFAPGLLPAPVDGSALRLGDECGGHVAETFEHKPQARMSHHRPVAAVNLVIRSA